MQVVEPDGRQGARIWLATTLAAVFRDIRDGKVPVGREFRLPERVAESEEEEVTRWEKQVGCPGTDVSGLRVPWDRRPDVVARVRAALLATLAG